MADKIGPKIAIEGEAAFKKAITEINTSLKTMGTEMKAVTSAYDRNDKSAENLTAQNQVLSKQIDAQKSKLAELTAMLDKSKSAYGANDAQTIKYQQSVNLATADLNKMERKLGDNNKAISEMGKGADAGGAKMEKFGSIAKTSALAIGAVTLAAGAAAVALGKAVVSAYADYEQLVGGVDTLFKESSQVLQGYAANAYKTAGLSANQYMETVTSFSASLISSLGGDTEKAVKYADMAITDMSDNANKMGSDMASIQDAYQGFAKQNYTMLDNLKLGYGGTKTEMERLLKDATAISGIRYDVSSYSDIVSAIHIIQTEMGITGTTALEAEKTISGSINAMKSAWQNWLVGLGNSEADMSGLTQNLVDGFRLVIENIAPIVQNMTRALPDAFGAILSAFGDILPELLKTVTDSFGTDTVKGIVEAIVKAMPLIIEAAVQIVTALAGGLIAAIPELLKATPKIVWAFFQSLGVLRDQMNAVGGDVVKGLYKGITGKAKWLLGRMKEWCGSIINAIKGWFKIESPSKVMRDEVGAMIGEGMAEGIDDSKDRVVGAAKTISTALMAEEERLQNELASLKKDTKKTNEQILEESLNAQLKLVQDFRKEYEDAIAEVEKSQEKMSEKLIAFGGLFERTQDELGKEIFGLNDLQAQIDTINKYGEALELLKQRGISESLMGEIEGMNIDDALDYTGKLLSLTDTKYAEYMALWEQKQLAAKAVATKFYQGEMDSLKSEFVDKIPVELSGIKNEMKDIGVNAGKGLADGFSSQSSYIQSTFTSVLERAMAAARASMDINSPSKKWADLVGAPMAQGLGVGFAEQMREVTRQINASIPTSVNNPTARMGEGIVNGLASIMPQSNNQPIIIQTVLDSKIVAQTIYDPLKNVARQKGVAFVG